MGVGGINPYLADPGQYGGMFGASIGNSTPTSSIGFVESFGNLISNGFDGKPDGVALVLPRVVAAGLTLTGGIVVMAAHGAMQVEPVVRDVTGTGDGNQVGGPSGGDTEGGTTEGGQCGGDDDETTRPVPEELGTGPSYMTEAEIARAAEVRAGVLINPGPEGTSFSLLSGPAPAGGLDPGWTSRPSQHDGGIGFAGPLDARMVDLVLGGGYTDPLEPGLM